MLDPTVYATCTSTGSSASLTVPAQAANNIGVFAQNNDHLSLYWLTISGEPAYLAYPGSTSLVWTDSTDTDTVTFTAVPGAPSVNAIKVVVATGAALAVRIATASNVTTVTYTINTGTTTPLLLKAFDAANPNGVVKISATTGTTIFSAFLASTALTVTTGNAVFGVGTFGPMIIPAGTVISILSTTGDSTCTVCRARLV
jgi:hypothetical protein